MRLRISVRSWTQHLLFLLSALPAATCGGSTGGGSPGVCEGAQPIKVDGVDTGYETCANGLLHRRENKVCPSQLPRAATCQADPLDDFTECTSDADCTAQPNGMCDRVDDFFQGYGCGCSYGCTKDSDCGAGQMCVCGSPVGYCEASTCTSADDCGGNLCSEYSTGEDECGYTYSAFACQSGDDSCSVDADCGSGEMCIFDETTKVRACGVWPEPTDECTEGRPFLVSGAARVAGVVSRADWISPDLPAPSAEPLTAAERAAIAAHYRRAGQMEHAAIAAFARFVLHLLSCGAPPDLVLSAQAAIADETAHARICFALASAHAGEAIGPDRLAIEGSLDDSDERAILITTLREGCIGETIAALEAKEALEHATDPAVRAALAQITEDERRHACLAWRYVAWALSRDDGTLRSIAAAELAAALTGAPAPATSPSLDEPLLGFGLLGAARRAEIRRQTLLHAVAPVARELLGIEIHGAGAPLRDVRASAAPA